MSQQTGAKDLNTLAFNYKNQGLFLNWNMGAQVNLQPLVLGFLVSRNPGGSERAAKSRINFACLGISLGWWTRHRMIAMTFTLSSA